MFKEAVRINPQSAESRCNLGNALLATGKPEEATAEFNEVLRQSPNFPPAVSGLARVRNKQEKKQ